MSDLGEGGAIVRREPRHIHTGMLRIRWWQSIAMADAWALARAHPSG
ncbi:MAG: hypothetical protein M5R42_07155 [Rhodocyclaceae bacterium]|nr:hypothetical protein [Rhodocyclaceae bacterium]